jgi:hypothetical protein
MHCICRHEYGKIEETMDILKVVQKGKRLVVLERFYLYKAGKQKHDMNEQYSTEHNVLFELLMTDSEQNV